MGLVIVLILLAAGQHSVEKFHNYREKKELNTHLQSADRFVYRRLKRLGMIKILKDKKIVIVKYISWREFIPFFLEDLNTIEIEFLEKEQEFKIENKKRYQKISSALYRLKNTQEIIGENTSCEPEIYSFEKIKEKYENKDHVYQDHFYCIKMTVVEGRSNGKAKIFF